MAEYIKENGQLVKIAGMPAKVEYWSEILEKPFNSVDSTTLSTTGGVLKVVNAETTWSQVTGKPFTSVDSADFSVTDGVLSSTIDLSPYAKSVDIPTNVSDLANDSGFITNAVNDLANYYLKTETYTQSEVNGLISSIPKFAIQVVAELPTEGISDTTIYLVVTGQESDNLYTEYIHVNGAWEKLGTQKVDLSNYYDKDAVDGLLSAKANTADLADVATSGKYTDLDELPNIPENVSDLEDGANYVQFTDVDNTSIVVEDGKLKATTQTVTWSGVTTKPFETVSSANFTVSGTELQIAANQFAAPGDVTSAIEALDASVSQTAGTDGLALSITEVDGKITAMSGSIAENTYDASGAAAAVQGSTTETVASVDAKIATLNGEATADGSIKKLIKDNAKDATYSDTQTISAAIASKYDSSNAYTKTEVDGLISSHTIPVATTETAGKVKPDGTSITVSADGTITAALPTKVSQLENDSNFITNAVNDLANYYLKTETYSQTEVNGLISAIPKFAIKVVSVLPTEGISDTTIYLVVTGEETENLYTEYIHVDNKWEKLGTQKVDLSNYYDKDAVDGLLAGKMNVVTLATVATSGSYTDLSNKPTIPTTVAELTDSTDYVKHTDVATSAAAGIVKPDGTTITIDADGTLHGATTYTLPTASTTTLGGVKIDGTTVTISEGVISANIDISSKQDKLTAGSNISISETNVISADIDDKYSTTESVIGKWIDNSAIYRKVLKAPEDTELEIEKKSEISSTIIKSDSVLDAGTNAKVVEYIIPQDIPVTIKISCVKPSGTCPVAVLTDEDRKTLVVQEGASGTYTINSASYNNKVKYIYVNSDSAEDTSVKLVGLAQETISGVSVLTRDYSYFSHAVDLSSNTLTATYHDYLILEYTKVSVQ